MSADDQMRAMAAPSLFPAGGEMRLPGLGAGVDVRRSAHGAYTIDASSLEDLWFAQGVVTAGERLFQLDLALRASTGRLSELFGERTIEEDRRVRTIGLHEAGRAMSRDWDEASRSMHARFRDGVRAWTEAMPAPPIEYTLLDATPDLPDDESDWAACFAFMAWSLSNNLEQEVLRAWIAEQAGPEAVGVLLPPIPTAAPALVAGALRGVLEAAASRPRGQGSNAWAVSGTRTASGAPLLANDPHLLVLQPSAWLQLRLRAPGYAARGVGLTFSPGILLGATDHHAWGATNVTGDVQDLYLERLDDAGTAARFGDDWEPVTVRHETIEVRGGDPVAFEVRETRHGPLLEAAAIGPLGRSNVPLRETYALRWAGRESGVRPSITIDAARATSFAEFRRVVQHGLTGLGLNVAYADVDGTIGSCTTGRFPIRAQGDGTAPVPGWDGAHEWTGWIPTDELPWIENPERGYLVTANNRIHDDDYPYLIGVDFHPPFRALRIAELLERRSDHDVDSMAAIQTDTVSLPARTMLPALLAGVENGDDRRTPALRLLRGWDGDLRADSATAALFNVWSGCIARRALGDMLGEDLFRAYHAWREPWHHQVLPALLETPSEIVPLGERLLGDSLDDAVAELHERLGEDPGTWSWGALHHARFAHPLAGIPGLETLFTAADVEMGGDEQTVNQGGLDTQHGYDAVVVPSWRVVWDLSDLDRSAEVLTTGNSGNPASPHWADQSPAWSEGRLLPVADPGGAEEPPLRLLPA